MKFHKNIWNIHEIHITSWLVKDIFWTLKLTWLATIMVVPTLILAIYILLTEKEDRDGNWTLFFWLLMNITWMLHELQNLPYWPVQIFMLLGIFNTLRLIVKRRKNESNLS
jgi:hypothetical protein